MRRRVPCALMLCIVAATAIVLSGCASRPAPTSSTLPGNAKSTSADATQALAGVWVPLRRDVSPELVSVSTATSGSVVVAVTTAGSDLHGSGKFGGQWHVAGVGEAFFQQSSAGTVNGRQMAGASATYRFVVTGNTLTLTWVGGRPPGAISAGLLHFRIEEGDSWITGSHGLFQFNRRPWPSVGGRVSRGSETVTASAPGSTASVRERTGPLGAYRDFDTVAYGMVVDRAHGATSPVPAVLISLRVNRSKATPSGEATVGAAILISAGTMKNLTVAPGYELVARGQGASDVLTSWFPSNPPGGFRHFNRYAGPDSLVAPLPVGTSSLVLTAFVGPTLAQAKEGVTVTVPIERVPVVDTAGGLEIMGHHSPPF